MADERARATAAGEERARATAASGQRATATAAIGAARVLVADDDPPLRRMLQRSLSADGFEVTVAADGPAALLEAERSAPDVIVLDVAVGLPAAA
jgi:PleD family two-component response regulator